MVLERCCAKAGKAGGSVRRTRSNGIVPAIHRDILKRQGLILARN
jgi:hypothetical protein